MGKGNGNAWKFSSSKIPVDWYRSANHGLRTRALIHGKQQQLQTVAKRFHFSHFALFFLVLRSWRKASILNFLFLKTKLVWLNQGYFDRKSNIKCFDIILILIRRTSLTSLTDTGHCSQAETLNTLLTTAHQSTHVGPLQQIALPAWTQNHYWLMAHWPRLRHQWLPENIKGFSAAQTASYRPLCATKKEQEWFSKVREEEEGGRMAH